MKITAIRATPVNIPLEAPYLWSYGSLAGFSKCIVEVETDEGITGLGEAPAPGMAGAIEGFGARLVGRDPIDIMGAEMACLPSWRGLAVTTDYARIRAFGAVEMALWDIRGKAWGQPLYQLLGGAVRRAVPVTDYFGFRGREPARMGARRGPRRSWSIACASTRSTGPRSSRARCSPPTRRRALRCCASCGPRCRMP